MNKAIILMGSQGDLDFCREIAKHLEALNLSYEFRVASAHKTPEKVLNILGQYKKQKVIYITVAGRSNALSAFVDANTTRPVIACPPYSEEYAGADIYSTLRVPSGIASLTTIEPEAAALAAAKLFALTDHTMEKRVEHYQQTKRAEIDKADQKIKAQE